MILRRFYHDGLAQASYLVGAASGEALVVDPNRDPESYLEAAVAEELRIVAVTETHIHADFVSGARELARRAGARLLLSREGEAVGWGYRDAAETGAELIGDGDELPVGEVRVLALHTPGHTPEHLSFLVTDTATAPEPVGVLTGDFVFVGDVGRPDLLESAAGVEGAKEEGARALWGSLGRFRELPDWVQVWPGHGAGSACGKALGAVPQSTVGYERLFGWAFRERDEAAFVRAVLDGLGAPPAYYARVKRVNRDGPAPLAVLTEPAELPADRLAREVARGLLLVDPRPSELFGAGHVPGSLNIPEGRSFLPWAGELLRDDRPLGLVADPAAARDLVGELRLIGLDDVVGAWAPDALAGAGLLSGTARRVGPERLRALRDGGAITVVDVRDGEERRGGRIAGSAHVPLAELPRRAVELPAGRPLVVHCQAGLRSAIGASLLRARGFPNVLELAGGFAAWEAAGAPVERG